MAVGTQFLQLVTRLKAELKRVPDVAVGVDDREVLKETLNHQYDLLYKQKDWAHLRKVFTLTLAAGQRYYTFPAGLSLDRIERVAAYWGGSPFDAQRGIDFEEYATYDSDNDQRADPVQRWDAKWTGSSTQIEVWPIPVTVQTMRFRGFQAISRLINDSDLCLLDDTLVVMFAAAELSNDSDDKKVKLSAAQEHLRVLTARMRVGSRHQLGLGHSGNAPAKIVVRVSG